MKNKSPRIIITTAKSSELAFNANCERSSLYECLSWSIGFVLSKKISKIKG